MTAMKKILIVDDEPHIRLLLEQTLEDLEDEAAVEISTAADGAEGLVAIRQQSPDLVFLDIMMPRMTGLDVCRALEEEKLLDRTTVILLTARGQNADRQEGLATGAKHYITKPFDPDEVLAVARQELAL